MVNNTLLEETSPVRNNTLEDCGRKSVIFFVGTLYMNIFLYALIAGFAIADAHKDTAAVSASSLPAANKGSVTTLNTLLEVE